MFSKSLFKQSCKANGMMWLIITVAVCFMLSCVMLISGNGNISRTKNAIEDTIIQAELTSSIQERALNYYEIGNDAMTHFDQTFVEQYRTAYTEIYTQVYQAAVAQGAPAEMAAQTAAEKAASLGVMKAYAAAATELQDVYYPAVIKEMGYAEDSDEATEVKGVIFYVLNPMQEDGTYMFDAFYQENGETSAHYTDLLATITEPTHADEREKYVMNNCSVFLAANMVKDETVEKTVDSLESFGVTREKYDDFGFADYRNVKDIAKSAVVDYRANLEYRLDNLKDGETVDSVKKDLKTELTSSMLATLPGEVSDALEEIGQMDMYGILVGTIFFKMAGLLLPIIYMIMTANALVAGQVDSGSMAYILSSSTKRRSVTFTQSTYLVLSLFAMFVCTAITSIVCLNIVDVDTGLTWKNLLLINLGAFLCMFAMSGICFLASCWFDRSKNSMAIGGGLSMFFLVATMLGLFGSPTIPSIIRMKALNYFNYASLITLFDTISIIEGTYTYLWKFAILVAVGVVCYIVGSIRFRKKDLPL